jgi:hypothetical protein
MKDNKHISDKDQNSDYVPRILQGLKDNNPLTVPEGYFEALPGKIKERIAREQEKAGKTRPLYKIVLYTTGLAAAVAALMIMFYFVLSNDDNNRNTGKMADNRQVYNAIEDYLLNNANIDEEAITEAIISDDDTIPLSAAQYDSIYSMDKDQQLQAADTVITRDDIIQYLLDEDFDSDTDL